MNSYYDLKSQLAKINIDKLDVYYGHSPLDSKVPRDIAKARIIAEENEVSLNLSTSQLEISQEEYVNLITERFHIEWKTDQNGGETRPTSTVSRSAVRRRQNKTRWCYATTALMYALDSHNITDKHINNINTYEPVLYHSDSKLRYRYCGYDAHYDKYYCDPGQEYVVKLCGDNPTSCIANSVYKAITLLTDKKVNKIGNNSSRFWTNQDGTLNLKLQERLANCLKLPAVCDVFYRGDSSTEKGHSLLINKMEYIDNRIILYTEDCVFGERPIIADFSNNVFTSVYFFESKITNIYYID